MGLEVAIQYFPYRILAHSILHLAASADAVFSILSLPRDFRGTRKLIHTFADYSCLVA